MFNPSHPNFHPSHQVFPSERATTKKFTLSWYPFESELEPSVTVSARLVSLLTGDGAFPMRLYACRNVGVLLRSATPPDNGAVLASMAPLKTGDGPPAGR